MRLSVNKNDFCLKVHESAAIILGNFVSGYCAQ